MKKSLLALLLPGLLFSARSLAEADSQASGLTLLSPAGAGAFALGEAYTAAANEIDAMRANPASLGSLQSGHASLYYNRGGLEDHYGQAMVGRKVRWGGIGLGVNYYDGGDLFSYDTGAERRLKAQRDVVLTMGQAFQIGPVWLGFAEKILRSELVERDATAFAADIGVQSDLSTRLRLGAALQNWGSALKYNQRRERLPRLARGGFSVILIPGDTRLLWLADGVYLADDNEGRGGTGLELQIGPLALRSGYLKGRNLERLSVGLGVRLARLAFDYGLGLIDELNSQHLVSLSTRFGE